MCSLFKENLTKTCNDEIKLERMWCKILIAWHISHISSDLCNILINANRCQTVTYTNNRNVWISIFSSQIETDTILFKKYYIILKFNFCKLTVERKTWCACSWKGWTWFWIRLTLLMNYRCTLKNPKKFLWRGIPTVGLTSSVRLHIHVPSHIFINEISLIVTLSKQYCCTQWDSNHQPWAS